MSSPKLGIAFAAGILAHNLVFRFGEWHMQAPAIIIVHLAFVLVALVVELSYSGGTSISSGLGRVSMVMSCYVSGLWLSMLVYRVFFHPLRHFKGPFLASTTKLWHVYRCLGCRNYKILDALYHRYGSFVRTGPNEITLFCPEAHEAMDGRGSQCEKSDWYDLLLPNLSVEFARDPAEHDARRRVWLRAINTKALSQYQPRLLKHIYKLEGKIAAAALSERPVLFNDIVNWFTFDTMGDFAFNKDFGMMDSEQWHSVVIMLRSAMTLLGTVSPAIWMARVGFAFIPGLWKVKDFLTLMSFCHQRMYDRLEMDVKEPDIASWLIADAQARGLRNEDRKWLAGDAATVVVAGSETTATSLIFLFYVLASHPLEAEKIFAEVSSIDAYDPLAVSQLTHLNATINETLRLFPALPTALPRKSPPAGLQIGDTFIPGGVNLVAPRYTIGRLESCYAEPEKFIPERWYSAPEMVKENRAFAPFSLGRHACTGKALALSELRHITALLVQKYHVSFAPGHSGESVERDMLDCATAQPGECWLVFRRRDREKGETEVKK